MRSTHAETDFAVLPRRASCLTPRRDGHARCRRRCSAAVAAPQLASARVLPSLPPARPVAGASRHWRRRALARNLAATCATATARSGVGRCRDSRRSPARPTTDIVAQDAAIQVGRARRHGDAAARARATPTRRSTRSRGWFAAQTAAMTSAPARFAHACGGASAALAASRRAARARARPRGRARHASSSSAAATAAPPRRSTCAMWSDGAIDVDAGRARIRRSSRARCRISCSAAAGRSPTSPYGYDGLARRGVRVVHDTATARRRRRGASSSCSAATELPYDRLVLSPGVDFIWDELPALDDARVRSARSCTRGRPGRRPSRCARSSRRCATAACSRSRFRSRRFAARPAPYERACQVGVVLQAREAARQGADPRRQRRRHVEEGAVQEGVGARTIKGIVEYRPNYVLTDVDAATRHRQVRVRRRRAGRRANVIPPQRAGAIARAGRRRHRQRPLVRSRLPDVRVDQGEERARAGRRDPDRAADAQVGAHGEPAGEGLRGGDRRVARRAARRTRRR